MAGGAFVAGSIVSKFLLDKTQWDSSIKAVGAQVDAFGKKSETASKQLGKMGSGMESAGRKLSLISLPLYAAGAAAIKLAVDASESENLFEVSMGGMAKSARDWSVELSKSLGLNQYEVRKTVATFNVMLSSMGLAPERAYEMSKGLVLLANDMSSLYNIPTDVAFQKLQSGIMGQVEPLRALGITIDETTIKQWAITHGVIKQGQELTTAQKIQARYNVILKATTAAQGDLGRTLESPANQMRLLKSKTEEMLITFGNMMLPVLSQVITKVKSAVDWFANLSEEKKKLILKIAAVVAVSGPLLLIFGKIFSLAGILVGGFSKLAGGVASVALKMSTLGGPAGAAASAIGGLNAPLTLAKMSLGKLALVGAAAFVGWKIGLLIGEVTGLNKHLEASFAKWIDVLGIAKSTAVIGEGHAAAAAKQQVILALAFQTTGKQAATLKEAVSLMTPTYEKMGTTGNTALDAIIKANLAGKVAQDATTAAAAKAAGAYTAVGIEAENAKEKIVTFAEYLQAEGILTIAEKAAKVALLEQRLKDLGKAYKTGKVDAVAYTAQAKKINDELRAMADEYKTVLPPARDLTEEMKQATGIGNQNIAWSDRYNEVLGDLGIKTIPMMKAESRALLQIQGLIAEAFAAGSLTGEEYARAMTEIGEKIRNVGKTEDEIPPKTERVSNAFQEMYLEVAGGLARTLVDFIGFSKALTGAATKHNEEYFTKAAEARTRDYELTIGAYDGILDAIQATYNQAMDEVNRYYDGIRDAAATAYENEKDAVGEATDEKLKSMKREYEDRRDYIMATVPDSAARDALLKQMDRDYEDSVDAVKRQEKEKLKAMEEEHKLYLQGIKDEELAKTKELAEKKKTEEDLLKADLKAIEDQYQLDIAKIKADEDRSRQQHADNEERRQNSLWTKVKGIFGSAVEAMITTLLTSKLGTLLESIFSNVTPAITTATTAVSGMGTAASAAATTIGGTLTGLATAIGTVITTLATAIATGITAIAGAIGGAIVTLATGIAGAVAALVPAIPGLLALGLAAAAVFLAFGLAAAVIAAARKVLGVGGGGGDDAANWLALIHPLVQEMHDMFRDLIAIQVYCQGRFDVMIDRLDWIGNLIAGMLGPVLDALGEIQSAIIGVPGAATGALVNGPTLLRVGENAPREPEIIAPVNSLGNFARAVQGPRNGAGADGAAGAAGTPTINIKPILIDKGDKWMIKFIQETINHGGIRIPVGAVGG